MTDPYNLQRFVEAQEPVIDQACAELAAGRKRSHWMWYVFPQIAGLGHSGIAQKFAIASLAEAKAYLAHPILGERIRKCADLVNRTNGPSIAEVFPFPDNLKFVSSMTLFAHAAAAENEVFLVAIEKYFGGEFDPLTMTRLSD